MIRQGCLRPSRCANAAGSELELVEAALVGSRLFERGYVFPLEVLDDGPLGEGPVVDVINMGRDVGEAGKLVSPVAPLATRMGCKSPWVLMEAASSASLASSNFLRG